MKIPFFFGICVMCFTGLGAMAQEMPDLLLPDPENVPPEKREKILKMIRESEAKNAAAQAESKRAQRELEETQKVAETAKRPKTDREKKKEFEAAVAQKARAMNLLFENAEELFSVPADQILKIDAGLLGGLALNFRAAAEDLGYQTYLGVTPDLFRKYERAANTLVPLRKTISAYIMDGKKESQECQVALQNFKSAALLITTEIKKDLSPEKLLTTWATPEKRAEVEKEKAEDERKEKLRGKPSAPGR